LIANIPLQDSQIQKEDKKMNNEKPEKMQPESMDVAAEKRE